MRAIESTYTRTTVTAATDTPVSLTEAKSQLRITASDEDTFLTALITAATEYTEKYLSRSLVSQTLSIWFDQFPDCDDVAMKIPAPPLISVSFIKYYDDDDVLQTWTSSEYVVDTDLNNPQVYPADGYSWPDPRVFHKSVNIQYVAGYADSGASPEDLADNVPTPIKQAILLLIGHLYENRESTAPGISINNVPMTYQTLLAPYRIRKF